MEKFKPNPDGTIDTREYVINQLIEDNERIKDAIILLSKLVEKGEWLDTPDKIYQILTQKSKELRK